MGQKNYENLYFDAHRRPPPVRTTIAAAVAAAAAAAAASCTAVTVAEVGEFRTKYFSYKVASSGFSSYYYKHHTCTIHTRYTVSSKVRAERAEVARMMTIFFKFKKEKEPTRGRNKSKPQL